MGYELEQRAKEEGKETEGNMKTGKGERYGERKRKGRVMEEGIDIYLATTQLSRGHEQNFFDDPAKVEDFVNPKCVGD